LYLATLQEVTTLADTRPEGSQIGILETEIRRQLELTDAAMREDTVRPFTETQFTTASDLMKQFAPARVRYVTCEVARLTGATPC
jgi:hypothetical protein